MKECVHEIWMPPLPSNINKGITPERKKSEMELDLTLMVLDLVFKYQMI